MKIEDIAKICHQANKALCEIYGDKTQVSWEDAPAWQRDSSVQGVLFKIDNPHVTPAQMHEKWSENKRNEGWIYGPIKDSSFKTHPCLVAYTDLPVEQQAKDSLFMSIVEALVNIQI